MFFNDTNFNAMKSGLDAIWLKQRVISDNIANYETPNYKAKEVNFQDVMRTAGTDAQGENKTEHNFIAKITTDEDTIARQDGNNVDMEKESTELWRTYAHYNYLTQKISGRFKNLRYVINQAMK